MHHEYIGVLQIFSGGFLGTIALHPPMLTEHVYIAKMGQKLNYVQHMSVLVGSNSLIILTTMQVLQVLPVLYTSYDCSSVSEAFSLGGRAKANARRTT